MSKPIELISEQVITTIKQIVAGALSRACSIALWHIPHTDKFQLLIDENNTSEIGKPNFEKSGFCLSRFVNPNLEETIFLSKDHLITFSTTDFDSDVNIIQSIFQSDSEELRWHSNKIAQLSTTKEAYAKTVENAMDAIAHKNFKKVIVSQAKTESIKTDFIDQFFKLTSKYPNAFCSLVSTESAGTWITASPETLVCVKDNLFKTVALAGTQKRTVDNLKDALWRQKEIEEQSYVSKYIINCLKKIRVREYEDIGPKTVVAGNLLHLQTEFTINMNEVKYPNLGETMLQLLHPTSAVCGMPKEASQDFILKNEKHDRDFYAGFLGPVNINGLTQLFVNLRCASIHQDKITYYAGAGITEDSEPIQEWEETELKIGTLRNVFTSK